MQHLPRREVRKTMASKMLHAVVIGINQYADESVTTLRYARADADAFAEALESGLAPADRAVVRLYDEAATRAQISIEVGEELSRRAQKDDIVVVFFAGHGSPESIDSPDHASRYLIAHDTQRKNIYATGLDLERDVKRWFERCPAAIVVCFIDACFSGSAGGRTFPGPTFDAFRAGTRSSGPPPLSELRLGAGRVVITACRDDQVAREEAGLLHGIFTYYLLAALTDPTLQGSTLPIGNLYTRVADEVDEHTRGKQTPLLRGDIALLKLPRLHYKQP